MAFDQATRNRLQSFVSDARRLLSDEFTQQLQNTYGLDPNTGAVAAVAELPSLSPDEQQTAKLLREMLDHYLAASHKADPYLDTDLVGTTLDRMVREQAFTVLNRLCALRIPHIARCGATCFGISHLVRKRTRNPPPGHLNLNEHDKYTRAVPAGFVTRPSWEKG